MSVARKLSNSFLVSIGIAAVLIAFAIRIANAAQVSLTSSGAAASPQPSASAQMTTPPSFDAASIKERDDSVAVRMFGMRALPGRLTAQCATLKSLLFYAYGFTYSSQVEGLPDGADTHCYDFQATMPAETTPEQARRMMQSLLADRFKLAIHWGKKTMQVYELVVAPGGFKLKPSDPAEAMKPGLPEAFRCPDDDPQCGRTMVGGTMAQLAGGLAVSAGRPVIDKTGIAGNYSGILKWASDTAPNSSLPSFSTAVRETFGLELKPETDSVDVLVIDHVEKPRPN